MNSLRGQLLISAGGLTDPDFRHTVVLVGEHGPEGALGIVLNRPSI
jgi:putative transcriptional regulator